MKRCDACGEISEKTRMRGAQRRSGVGSFTDRIRTFTKLLSRYLCGGEARGVGCGGSVRVRFPSVEACVRVGGTGPWRENWVSVRARGR